jgi:hypothetical protein
MAHAEFEERLRKLIGGEIPIEGDYNEFVGHAEVVRQLLEVAPDAIRDDLQFLHDLMADARDASGAAVLGIFPRLTDPDLALVEGRISDFVAEHCGLRYGDGRYEAGKLVGESRLPGWPGLGSPLTNNRFPYLLDTSASNYFSNRFWHGEGGPPGFIPVPTGGKVVFRGEYLRARYFAFHPSDFDTNTLPTLVDVDLEADAGSANPYRGPVPEGIDRRFTATLDFGPQPDSPAPNTSYVARKRNGEPNPAVFNILRTTGSVLGALPPNTTGVPLPSVSVYDAEGNRTLHYEEADPYPPGSEPPVETTHLAPLPIPDWRGLTHPGKLDVKSNWGLPYDILASDDIFYLTAPYSTRWGDVFVLRTKAFSTPRTPEEPPYAEGKQVRAFTVTNYNFWAGIANTSIIDHEIARDSEDYITLVVCTDENRPANATPQNGCTWIDWGPYLDGQLTFRFLIRRDPLLVALRRAITEDVVDDEIAPYVPTTGHCSREDFEREGWRAVSS